MDIVLSIKSKYARKIYNGSKKVEYRRVIPSKTFDNVYVYESGDVQRITGCFCVEKILTLPLEELWDLTKNYSGITKEEFLYYFRGKTIGNAFIIKDVEEFEISFGINLFDFQKPPQNFCYYEFKRPSKLYKYTSAFLGYKILKENCLKLNKPCDYNDPFDSNICIDENELKRYRDDEYCIQLFPILMQLIQGKKYNKKIEDLIAITNEEFNNYNNDKLNRIYRKVPKIITDFIIKQYKENFLQLDNNFLKNDFEDNIDYLNSRFLKSMENFYVTCVSTDNKNILMWSHYSDQHKGICIEFEFADIFKPIHYQKKRPLLNMYRFYQMHELQSFLYPFTLKAENELVNEAFEILLTKSEDWKYEKEYRYINTNILKNDDSFIVKSGAEYYLQLPKITCVYIGARYKINKSNETLINDIIRLCMEKEIPIKLMITDNRTFSLNAVDYN